MKTILILGALDTKGEEFLFLKKQIEQYDDVKTYVIDTGMGSKPFFEADCSSSEVAKAFGVNIEDYRGKQVTRDVVQDTMGQGAAIIVKKLVDEGKIDGFIGMGGGQGLGIASKVMAVLPFGFPKVMVQTGVGIEHHQENFPKCRDAFLVNPSTDVAGINEIFCTVVANAAAAIVGLVHAKPLDKTIFSGKRISITMLGVTTDCGQRVKDNLSANGYEVLTYHCTGVGGQSMESLIRDGVIKGVVDLTPSEVFHQYILGTSYPVNNPKRMEVAGEMGIPQIVVPGGLDLITWFGYTVDHLPDQIKDQNRTVIPLGKDNAFVLRTNIEENKYIGKVFAEKLNKAKGPVVLVLPLRGLSRYDMPGKPFWSPETDKTLLDTIKANLNSNIKVVEVDCHINDQEFSDTINSIAVDLFKDIK